MTTVLVLTDGTEVGTHVTTRVHELRLESPDLGVHVLIPAAKRIPSLHGHEIDGSERAAEQLSDALQLFINMGVPVTGQVGGQDPVRATRDVLSTVQPDLILVSTLPLGSSRWLNMDLPHRLRRRFGIPVEYTMGRPVNDNDWYITPQKLSGPVRILLVEDSPAEAKLMRHVLDLSDEQIDLTVTGNGGEAVKALRAKGQDTIDLVLLDLEMPEVDGHEFLELVAAEFNVDDLNVTVVTSSTATHDREKAHALGAGAYVYKDPDINVFTETIHSVIDEVTGV